MLAGVGCVHPRSLAPLEGAGVCGGRNRGCSLALDPRLISVTPTGVGRAGIGRSCRNREVALGSNDRAGIGRSVCETEAVGVGACAGCVG